MKTNAFYLILLAILFSVYYMILPLESFNNTVFDIGQVLIIVSVVAFVVYSQKGPLKGYWIRPSILFIIGYLAVDFQYLLDFRIGLKNASSFVIVNPIVLNHCMILGVVGLLAFVAGYIIRPINCGIARVNNNHQVFSIPIAPLVILNAALFVAFVTTLDFVSFVTGAGYGHEDSANTYVEMLLYVSISLIVLAVCLKSPASSTFGNYLKSFPKVSLAVIGLYMILRLVSGDRGPFIYTGMLLFFGYAYSTRRKIRLVSVIGVLFAAMVFVSVAGIARSLDTQVSFSERMGDAFAIFKSSGRFADRDGKSVLPMTEELGFSFLVNQTDVDAVEVNGASLNYGMYTIYGIASSIPFIPRFIQKTLGVSPIDYSSSGFSNYHYFGGYDRNWGIGTTIVGDFYLQFGVWGVLIGLFLTGLFFRYLDANLYVKDKTLIGAYSLLFILLFAAKSIYIPRALLLVELPRFVLGMLVLLVLGVNRKHL